MPEANDPEETAARPIASLFRGKGLLNKIDWYAFEDTSEKIDGGLGAGAKAADDGRTPKLGETHSLIAGARESKTCPRCSWLCDKTDIECYRCGDRFNVNQQFVTDLRKLGADVGARQVRFEAPFNATRLANTARSSVDAFLLRLQAETLRCSSGFEELIALDQLNIDHYDYQIETVKRVLQDMRGTALLADEVGLGKTIEAGLILKELDARALTENVLILTPSGLTREPWETTLRERFAMDFTVIGEERDWAKVGAGPRRLVMSIDLAWRPAHLARLLQTEWDMLVIDEAHYLRNRASLRYKGINRIRKRYCLMLTATPVQNHIIELYGLISLLKPGHLGTIRKFKQQYFRTAAGRDPDVNNPAALQKLLYQVMVRNRRATVGLKLPKRVAAVVHLKATKDEMSLYNDLSDFIRNTVRRSKQEERSLRLALITLQRELASSAAAVAHTLEGMAADDKISATERAQLAAFAARARKITVETKVQAAVEIVKAAGGQFVIFTEYLPSGERLKAALEREGISTVFFSGGLSSKQKPVAINDFRAGKTQVFIATRTGSEGHNLQFCHQLINFDLPWNPMIIEQRIGRLHRIGQKNEVYVFNLAVDGTVEERVLQLLAQKIRIFNLVVGELDMVLGQMESPKTFEELLREAWLEAGNNAEAMAKIDAKGDEFAKARAKYDKTKGANNFMDEVLSHVTAARPGKPSGVAA